MLSIIINYAAFLLLLWAAISDLRCRIIPNTLSLFLFVLGLVAACARHDLACSLVVLAVVGVGFYALWILRVLGGGDVKLLFGLLLLIPRSDLPQFVMGTAECGSLLALPYIFFDIQQKRKFDGSKVIRSVDDSISSMAAGDEVDKKNTIPYGVAIMMGFFFNVFV